jgi:hypothetical protein
VAWSVLGCCGAGPPWTYHGRGDRGGDSMGSEGRLRVFDVAKIRLSHLTSAALPIPSAQTSVTPQLTCSGHYPALVRWKRWLLMPRRWRQV